MRRLLALSAVPGLGLILLGPATPAWAQGNGPCIHQGQQVQCPPGLPPGSQSVAFVPGGTNWRNSVTGAIVFVPSTTFPPFMAGPSPTAPPGPTTQPGPGTQPTGPSPVLPLTTEGLLTLTRPSDWSPAGTVEDPNALAVARDRRERVETSIRELDRVFRSDYFGMEIEFEGRDAAQRAQLAVQIEEALRARAPQSPTSADGSGDTRRLVGQSDAEKAPTFEPFKDAKAVDEVM
jgi:hypothetical protein